MVSFKYWHLCSLLHLSLTEEGPHSHRFFNAPTLPALQDLDFSLGASPLHPLRGACRCFWKGHHAIF